MNTTQYKELNLIEYIMNISLWFLLIFLISMLIKTFVC